MAMANTSANPLTHGSIFRRYWVLITGTLVLLALENTITVLVPYLMGAAIDGLIAKDNSALFVFFWTVMAGLVIGILRRLYDTRIYGRIHKETAGEIIAKEINRDANVSKMTARANFVSEFAEFFELHLPAALMAGFMLVGSVVMLAVISPILSLGTVLVAAITGLTFFFSRKRIQRLNAALNDEMEQQVDVLTLRDNAKVAHHFSALVRWRIRLSDLEARNFGISFFCALVLLSVAVYILVAVEGKSAGQAFAGLTYILQFTEASIILPYTYQSFLRTTEISKRLSDD